jgi:prepilin-type N-terminal cleavage/methylation domain-containing protein
MNTARRKQRGFTLIEMMFVLVIMSIMMAAVFQQINQVIQRSSAEQTKLDMFQEAREFMDQLSRDLHQAGYPNQNNFAPNQLGSVTKPIPNDSKVAVGLVRVAPGELVFEGDVDGSGQVSSVSYHLDNTSVGCTPQPCLRRSQVTPKADNTAPTAQQATASFQTEVQNVQNDVSSPLGYIFHAYRGDGTEVTLPVDFATNANTIAGINTIKVVLIVQAQNPDRSVLNTGVRPVNTLISTIKLNNCSQAAFSQPMSCQ